VTHILQGRRVFLRPFERSDAETYRRWRADAAPMSLAGWSDRAPLSLAEVEGRIERLATDHGKEGFSFLICLLDDERPIGEAMLFGIDRANGNAGLGIFIGEPDEWGKGYGTDAVDVLVAFAFEELRVERVWLNVGTDNARARRSYEKAGFVHEGTLRHDRYEGGRYTDGDMMSILREEWLALPRNTVPGGIPAADGEDS
jgi:RimJ/RimL family protein N-acetyltransferase